MSLSGFAVRQPVAGAVVALLLVILGVFAGLRLPVRENPDVDPPVVSVSVGYPAASAAVVERDVTQVIEDNLSGIDDVERITSTSRDGFAEIDVEFTLGRDLDAAAADVRDRVSAVRQELPEEADEPVISKASAGSQAMMWITLTSDRRDRRALTDFAIRNLVDPLSIVPGVAQVLLGGERRYAIRVWLDRAALAAHGVTVSDVTRVLRAENVELPGGRINTGAREIGVRTETKLRDAGEVRDLVVRDAERGQVRLGDVARVELGAENDRSAVFRNGEPAAGLGIIRQSGSNTLAVARGVRAELDRLASRVPDDIGIDIAFDQSVFIEGSIREVVKTLLLTAVLVVAVIYLFLGSLKATLVPAATIPAALVATLGVLLVLGYSINTLTLLALVLAIGLVVDDAIVVLESAVRHREEGEGRLAAAVRGGSEVSLAVVSTTAVLVAVLLPIATATGTVGRLFTEFAVALSATLVFSALLALTLGTTLASRLADPAPPAGRRNPLHWPRRALDAASRGYGRLVERLVRASWTVLAVALLLGAALVPLFTLLPGELAPTEDRGAFIIPLSTPQGADLQQTLAAIDGIERILADHRGPDGPIEQTIAIAGTGRGGPPKVTEALVIVKLKPWEERRQSQQALVQELQPKLLALPGAQAVPINPASLVPEGLGKPIQFVISGPDYGTAYGWADQVAAEARGLGSMQGIEIDFDRRSPQFRIEVDRRRAADLGLSVSEIGETLRIFFGGDDITEYYDDGETYQVMVRGRPEDRDRRSDLTDLQVRADGGALVPLASVVEVGIEGAADSYRRVGRRPSMVITAVPARGEEIGGILDSLARIAEERLPDAAQIGYLGTSEEYRRSSAQLYVVFALALLVVYLVLAALFGSFVQPAAVMIAVPLSIVGGLAIMLAAGLTLNVFSQIALLLLVGLLAKNAVLLVDFANRRRRAGVELVAATAEAARLRFRPIVMTSISTVFGAVPLALATGPGAEARTTMGLVIIAGVIGATLITLFIVPGLYALLACIGAEPGRTERQVEEQLAAGGGEGREG